MEPFVTAAHSPLGASIKSGRNRIQQALRIDPAPERPLG